VRQQVFLGSVPTVPLFLKNKKSWESGVKGVFGARGLVGVN
jgi:hypothetical protein